MSIPPLQTVADGISVSLGKLGSNNGVISTPAGVVLVDVPHKPTDARSLLDLLADIGPVRWVVHTDHTLTNGMFPGTVVAHERTRRQLHHNMPTPGFVEQLLTVLDPGGWDLLVAQPERVPDVGFRDRLELDVGGTEVVLLALPGHTPNTIGVHIAERGVLFSGDTVCEMGLPSFQESSFRAWRASIDVVLGLDFDVLVPGHGVVGDRTTALRFREQIDELIGQVEAARAAGRPEDETVERIRFEDRIHVSSEAYTGYPDDMIEEFQRRSIRAVWAELGRPADVPGDAWPATDPLPRTG